MIKNVFVLGIHVKTKVLKSIELVCLANSELAYIKLTYIKSYTFT